MSPVVTGEGCTALNPVAAFEKSKTRRARGAAYAAIPPETGGGARNTGGSPGGSPRTRPVHRPRLRRAVCLKALPASGVSPSLSVPSTPLNTTHDLPSPSAHESHWSRPR